MINKCEKTSLFFIVRNVVLCWSLLSIPFYAYAANPVKGGGLYSVHCASCHGIAGEGAVIDAYSFNQGDSLMQADLVLLNSIRNGKDAMPAYRGILTDIEILDLIAFLRTLN